MPRVAKKAFIIREVWNPVCFHGNKTGPMDSWSAKLQLHKSNIFPHLAYCDIVWHFCQSSDKKKMERIQERAFRAVFKSKSETYSELLTRAGLPSLYQQRLQNITIFMYKVKNGLVPRLYNRRIQY